MPFEGDEDNTETLRDILYRIEKSLLKLIKYIVPKEQKALTRDQICFEGE